MKRFFVMLALLISIPLMAQEGIKYEVGTVEFTKRIDSTTVNDYTKLSIDWDKGYENTWFTGGNYTLYCYIDSCKNSSNQWIDSVLIGDTDSLFIYIKARVPTTTEVSDTVIASYEVYNDSMFVTPSSSTTGFDFELDKWYQWDFELSRARGVDMWIKRQCDTGGLTFRFVITK